MRHLILLGLLLSSTSSKDVSKPLGASDVPIGLDALGVTLYKTSTRIVTKRFAGAVFSHVGEADHSETHACLLLADHPDVVLQVVSDTELSEGVVSAFRIVKKTNEAFACGAPAVPTKIRLDDLKFPRGVTLGMQHEEVQRRLGAFEKASPNEPWQKFVGASFEVHFPRSDLPEPRPGAPAYSCIDAEGPFYDVTWRYTLNFDAGELTEMGINYAETC